jgi:uncharacterized caspase-like protein
MRLPFANYKPTKSLAMLTRATPVAIMCVTVMAGTAEAKRLALVVGNSDYEHVYSLKNAAKDATDVAKALERLDFEVTLLTDTNEAGFWEKLEAFAAQADAEEVESTLFYFSGHAFQMDGANYLVPSDAALTSKEAIQNQTWRLDEIVKKLEDRNRQTLIFLDACRNNPLPETQRGSTGEGLAKLQTGSGTFVAFATQPNNVTADGAGDNSPFTDALLEAMESKGISISDMMIRVRNSVEDATFGRQTPWDQSSLRAQFYFKPVVERSATLTEADYEMIAALDPETRNRLLEALAKTGLQIDEEEVAIQEEAQVAALNPSFLIEDPDAPVTDASAAAAPIPDAKPEEDAPQGAFAILDVEDVPDDGGESTTIAVATVEPSAPSTTAPLQPSSATTATGDSTTVTCTQLAGAVAQPLTGSTFEPSPQLETITLAALSDTRALEPIFPPRSRVQGDEVTREDAAKIGIDLPEEEEALTGRTLAREVQIELQRLGCYRSSIDGLWGKGSALALVRYYGNTGTAATSLDPTMSVLRDLRIEPNVVCKVVQEIKNVKVAKAKKKIRATKAAAAPKKAVAKSGKKKIRLTTTTKSKTGGAKKKTVRPINSGVFR